MEIKGLGKNFYAAIFMITFGCYVAGYPEIAGWFLVVFGVITIFISNSLADIRMKKQ